MDITGVLSVTCKKAVLVYLKLLPRFLSEGTEEELENVSEGSLLS
jgi:hypothetical protein